MSIRSLLIKWHVLTSFIALTWTEPSSMALFITSRLPIQAAR